MGRRWFLIHALSPAISGPDQVEDLCGASLGSDMCACAAADCKVGLSHKPPPPTVRSRSWARLVPRMSGIGSRLVSLDLSSGAHVYDWSTLQRALDWWRARWTGRVVALSMTSHSATCSGLVEGATCLRPLFLSALFLSASSLAFFLSPPPR